MEKDDKGTEHRRALFARIGYMQYYSGSQKGDLKPIGGGGYNEENIGGELLNFKAVNGNLLGYYQPSSSRGVSWEDVTTNLERIDPEADGAASLDDVLVIFIARSPQHGQIVVGWYRGARVYRHFQRRRRSKGGQAHYFNTKAKANSAVLLPTPNRVHVIPTGKGGAGQSNSCYVLDKNGAPKKSAWIRKAIGYVDNYEGGNLLESPDEDFEQEAADLLESHRGKQSGRGFGITPQLRKQIEEYAMARAKRHFRDEEYRVQDLSKRRPFDLLCIKGGSELRVEVKGTQTDAKSVILTKNEVTNAREHRVALFIVHSIKAKKRYSKYRLSGAKHLLAVPGRRESHEGPHKSLAPSRDQGYLIRAQTAQRLL